MIVSNAAVAGLILMPFAASALELIAIWWIHGMDKLKHNKQKVARVTFAVLVVVWLLEIVWIWRGMA